MSAHCLLSERNEYQDFQHTSKYPVARVEFTMHGINCPSMDCKASKNNINPSNFQSTGGLEGNDMKLYFLKTYTIFYCSNYHLQK